MHFILLKRLLHYSKTNELLLIHIAIALWWTAHPARVFPLPLGLHRTNGLENDWMGMLS